jgi:hypothetical protein
MNNHNDDDVLLNGAEAIGRALGFVDADGKVDLSKTYYVLERGYVSASKLGRKWISTRTRIRQAYTGEATAQSGASAKAAG